MGFFLYWFCMKRLLMKSSPMLRDAGLRQESLSSSPLFAPLMRIASPNHKTSLVFQNNTVKVWPGIIHFKPPTSNPHPHLFSLSGFSEAFPRVILTFFSHPNPKVQSGTHEPQLNARMETLGNTWSFTHIRMLHL